MTRARGSQAAKIQATQRGKQARRKQDATKQDVAKQDAEQMESAASKIQSVHRGKKARPPSALWSAAGGLGATARMWTDLGVRRRRARPTLKSGSRR